MSKTQNAGFDRPRLIISQSDRDAAALVVTRAVTVLTLAAIRKGRWRATIGDDFLTDWTIVKRVLIKHQSFRDFAKELGLDERAIRQRFHSAIEAIAAAIGPVQWPKSLSPHPAHIVGGRVKGWAGARNGATSFMFMLIGRTSRAGTKCWHLNWIW